MRVRLEDDFVQLFTPEKRILFEYPNAARNYDFRYSAFFEPLVSNSLKTVWEKEHFQVLLAESELFRRLFNLLRYCQVCDGRLSKTKPAELLKALVQLNIFQCTTISEGHRPNLLQRGWGCE